MCLLLHDEPPTAPNGQGLTTDALPYQLDIWIIGTGIAFNHLTSSIHRLARESCPLQCFSHFCSSHPGVDLRHAHGVMAKKTPDYFQGDIIIDETHPHRVPELMGLQVVQTTVTISDVFFECPSVQPIAEGQSEKGQWLTASSFERACE